MTCGQSRENELNWREMKRQHPLGSVLPLGIDHESCSQLHLAPSGFPNLCWHVVSTLHDERVCSVCKALGSTPEESFSVLLN